METSDLNTRPFVFLLSITTLNGRTVIAYGTIG
jgi:hypothetical protein